MNQVSTEADLAELRRPIIQTVSMACLAIAWIWVAAASTVNDELPPAAPLVAPALLLVASAVSLATKNVLSVTARSYVLLVGMAVSLFSAYRVSPSSGWAFYQAVPVMTASLLTGIGSSFLLALAVTGGLLLPLPAGPQPLAALASPLGLVWAAAVTSWLSSRSLYATLGWALRSQARAWEAATDARQRREQLRRTLDSLKNAHVTLERTARELEAAQFEAEEARRTKSRFVANISHELRTPLNIIVGFAEMICTSPDDYGIATIPPVLREDLLKIWRNSEHVLGMIDDVLDLAQIEAARLPVVPEPTDLLQLIRETLVAASVLIRDSGADLRVSLPAQATTVNVDRTRIRQVLLNLVNNAVRYAPGGRVQVGAERREGEVIVYVRDSGPGIPADRLEAIFGEFERADDIGRPASRSTGLGLTISRHFMRLHGGRMWAESDLGRGSTFYFSLPLPNHAMPVQPVQPRRPMAPSAPPAEVPWLVTLCQDRAAVRMLERHLGKWRVAAAASPTETAVLVREHHPEAVLVAADSIEQTAAAVEQAQELLAATPDLELPIIVSTVPTERQARAALGVADFLAKPVTREDVLEAVRGVAPNPRRLLVVEDDPDMLGLLVRMLAGEWPRAEVLAASSGDKALVALKDEPRPDVMLLDLVMRQMGGVELLGRLRSQPGMRALPVVVISARAPAPDASAPHQGAIHILRRTGLTAAETIRFVEMLTKALPPRYADGAANLRGTPEAAPA